MRSLSLGMDDESVIIGDPAFGKIYQIGKTEFLDRHWRNQYVPIFRPLDLVLAPAQTAELLYRSGFLSQSEGNQSDHLKAALQQFQKVMRVAPTGELDAETALLLSGQFLDKVPRLDRTVTIDPS